MQIYTLAEKTFLTKSGYTEAQMDDGNIEIADAQIRMIDRIEAIEEALTNVLGA